MPDSTDHPEGTSHVGVTIAGSSEEKPNDSRVREMGKLIVHMFVTLDGVYQAPGEPDEDLEGGFRLGGWQAPYLDAESGQVMFDEMASLDALLAGAEDLCDLRHLLAQRSRGSAVHRIAQRNTQVRSFTNDASCRLVSDHDHSPCARRRRPAEGRAP
jgi:hypothetical protein